MIQLNKAAYNSLNKKLFENNPENQHNLRYQIVAVAIASVLDLDTDSPKEIINRAVSEANEEYQINVSSAIKLALELFQARISIKDGFLTELVNGYFTLAINELDSRDLFVKSEVITEDCDACGSIAY